MEQESTTAAGVQTVSAGGVRVAVEGCVSKARGKNTCSKLTSPRAMALSTPYTVQSHDVPKKEAGTE